ncbi:MAG TPA: TrkA family potassium uptake protein [Gemmatimonadaceae bacterium]|nr:TrkA family potassium uptake protein [Gemmatimonadaceae bacterium]
MKRYVVIGLGNFGMTVVEALHARGHDVVAVDSREEAVDRAAPTATRAVLGDGRNLRTLEAVGARGAHVGVVSTGDDIAASILTTMALRDLGVPEIFVKVISTDHARVMEKLGVTETIFPERESAQRLATRIESTSILNYVRLGGDFSIQEMAVPTGWVGKRLRELRLRDRFGVSVVAVHDMLRDQMVAVPDPDYHLTESDTLLVAGTARDLERAAAQA